MVRPANVVTSIADVMAGLAIVISVEAVEWTHAIMLILSTACLYAGGIVFNDYFDRHIDATERPERAIPSGKVSPANAVVFGSILFLIALSAAFYVSRESFYLACAITVTALLYDKWMKHYVVAGPLFMGMARGFNLLLGISISALALMAFNWLAIIPLIFIASVTLTSRKENAGNNRSAMLIAMFLDLCVTALLIVAAFIINGSLWPSILLIAVWSIFVLSAKWRAYRINTPENIRNAVKMGVMSLIIMDASYALMASAYVFVVVILCLLPVSIQLARKFAVT